MATVKRVFVVEIEVDDSVEEKYPNYKFNYSNINEFIDAEINSIRFLCGVDMAKDGMNEYGFTINIKEDGK